MPKFRFAPPRGLRTALGALSLGALSIGALSVAAVLPAARLEAQELQFSAFAQGVAEAASRTDDLAAFYRSRDFEGIWTGTDEAAQMRRNAFLGALTSASMHGLPESRFSADRALTILLAAQTARDRSAAEVEMSRLFLDFARAINSGVIEPQAVVSHIKREVQHRSGREILESFAENPVALLRSLPPSAPEYQRLIRAKLSLEALIADGGYGPEVQTALEPGASGDQVVRLRNRLIRMGWLDRSVGSVYERDLVRAVEAFQRSVNLEPDGVVGGATLEALNRSATERLEQVLVAMERERWFNNLDRGDRHVWVNLTDFTATIVDHDAVTFRTKSVIGAGASDRQTPEFSDVMEHMVINPYWYVPRSIIRGEYGGQVPRGFEAIDYRGRVVPVSSVYGANGSMNYSIRQPPGPSNALGRVKFMFPNVYNIYLHDTPAQHLFSRTVRTFSHGCIRLDDPYDFAYALLGPQTEDPVGFFQTRLNSGANTHVPLEEQVPVHLVYRTAFTAVDGTLHFRDDIYGRDARIWSALAAEGVEIAGPSG